MDNHDARQAFYAMWRFDMWSKGYGTYNDIDEAVATGDLEPGNDYPPKRAEERTGAEQ